MFFTYILQSQKNKSFYIGFAPNLKARLEKHNQGLVFSTKNLRPLTVVYFEAYRDKRDALQREKQLKRFAKGFAQLKRRIKFSML